MTDQSPSVPLLTRTMATSMLEAAIEEAWKSLREGGIPIGAALFRIDGSLLGSGHNRRIQDDDPGAHAEIVAFRNAGRRERYRDTVMVSTIDPCLFCSGLIRQFHIGYLIVGENNNFQGAGEQLRAEGVTVMNLNDNRCVSLMRDFIASNGDIWDEDIGEDHFSEH